MTGGMGEAEKRFCIGIPPINEGGLAVCATSVKMTIERR